MTLREPTNRMKAEERAAAPGKEGCAGMRPEDGNFHSCLDSRPACRVPSLQTSGSPAHSLPRVGASLAGPVSLTDPPGPEGQHLSRGPGPDGRRLGKQGAGPPAHPREIQQAQGTTKGKVNTVGS